MAEATIIDGSAVAQGLRSLKSDCIEKLRSGHTTFEEFLKASFD